MLNNAVKALQPPHRPASSKGLIGMLLADANAGLMPSHLSTCNSTSYHSELAVGFLDCLTEDAATLHMHTRICIGHLH